MKEAILSAAQFGRVTGMAADIVRCGMINRTLGTSFAPWELGDLPEEWIGAIEMWSEEFPRAQRWAREARAALDRLRSQKKQ